MTSTLKPFFEPKGTAIIGASGSPEKLSYGILKNMTLYGYKGRIYPVNPKSNQILGLKSYPNILEVPDPVDLAVVILPAVYIADVLEDCGKRGIHAVTIISGGFKEVGSEGHQLEERITEIAKEHKIRLIGPNCVGTMNLITGLNTTFIKGVPATGGIGFISQSGAICGGVVDHVVNEGIGFSHFLSLGNEADVDETDMIEYLANDPDTRVITAYIEGIQNGQKFLHLAREVTKRKPIIVLKAGRSEEGAKAVSSHTGSLAGSHSAYASAFKQAGVFEVFSTTDLLNTSMALDWLSTPQGKRVAIVTNSGGPAALASDSLSLYGLRLALIEAATQEEMREKLNPAAQTANPVDMLGGANEEEYLHALNKVLADTGVDMALAILVPQALVNPEKVAEAIVQAAKLTNKPVIACLMGKESIKEAHKILHDNHVPMVDYPELTGVMFGALYSRITRRGESRDLMSAMIKVNKTAAQNIFISRQGNKAWGEFPTRQLLDTYGFPLVDAGLATSIEMAQNIVEQLGFPVVMKTASDEILHKSDAGVVAVDIKDAKALKSAYLNILQNAKNNVPGAKVEGVLVEKMAPDGKEVIVGVKRDPGFGPLVMFGMGGIFVELFKDVAFRVAPLTRKDAEEMVMETKAFKLLEGWRGGSRYDLEAIYDIILRLSKLADDFPQIEEIEINPLRVFPAGQGALALDCRMITN